MTLRQLITCTLLFLSAHPFMADSAERVALVIGNSNYQTASVLPNTLNDASDIAGVLRDRLGFNVIQHTNIDRRDLHQALREFRQALRGSRIGLFFYAGHAAQFNNRGYLIPINAQISAAADLPIEGISADNVLEQMQSVGTEISVVVLDACRDTPYPGATRSATRGLARIEASPGSLIAYATRPGGVADDGKGRNSPYTAVLKQELTKPGQSLTDLFNNVGWKVSQNTKGKQVPWMENSPLPPVYLAGVGAAMTSVMPVDEVTPQKTYLTIKPTPATALVRIMNISPRYRGGVELTPGQYDLEVSAEGYQVHRQWYELAVGEQVLAITLEPEKEPVTIKPERLKPRYPIPKMVRIPGGCYQMGSPRSEIGRYNDERQHQVCVDEFYLGHYEITFAEYDAFVEATGREKPDDGGWGRGTRPVINISWNDATAYAEWLSEKTGERYRLPTEAEWEYAARAGTTTAYWWGAKASHEYANYGKDRCCGGLAEGLDEWTNTAPVGSFNANGYGLYDMIGNVLEWTCSLYVEDYNGAEQKCMSKSQANSTRLVLRGGSWDGTPPGVRTAIRYGEHADNRNNVVGFRLARF